MLLFPDKNFEMCPQRAASCSNCPSQCMLLSESIGPAWKSLCNKSPSVHPHFWMSLRTASTFSPSVKCLEQMLCTGSPVFNENTPVDICTGACTARPWQSSWKQMFGETLRVWVCFSVCASNYNNVLLHRLVLHCSPLFNFSPLFN